MREKPGVVEGGSLSGSVTFYQRVVVVRRSNGTVELTIKFQGFNLYSPTVELSPKQIAPRPS